jgi:hypothetical protein
MHTGLAQRMPKGHLVGGKYRPTQIFLERRNDTNYTEAVAAKQNSLSLSRHLRPRPCVKLSRTYLGKFAQRIVWFWRWKNPLGAAGLRKRRRILGF